MGVPLAWRSLVAIAAAALLAGCAQAPAPEDRYFRLLVPPASRSSQPLLPGTLLVERFSADGLLDQRAIAYAAADAPNALRQYHYHFWVDSPTLLLRDFTVDWLRAAGVADRVVVAEHGVDATHVLVGRIRRLEHLRGDAPSVAISVELGVTRARDGALLLLETYAARRALAGTGIAAVARTIDSALAGILERFRADLEAR